MKRRKVIALALAISMLICLLLPGCSLFCEHKETTWVVVTEPTCAREGEKQEKCLQCGKVLITNSIARTDDHVYHRESYSGNDYYDGKCIYCGEIDTYTLIAENAMSKVFWKGLKYPDSLKLYGVKYILASDSDSYMLLYVDFSAANAYGVSARDTKKIYVWFSETQFTCVDADTDNTQSYQNYSYTTPAVEYHSLKEFEDFWKYYIKESHYD